VLRDGELLMRLRTAIVASLTGVLCLAALAALGLLTIRHVPDFYQRALEVDDVDERRASDELLRRVSALANQVRHEGRWSVVLTVRQLNGWLAVDRAENHPTLLPPDVTDPRVAFGANSASVACRYSSEWLSAVFSVDFGLQVVEPNVVALRVLRARAGRMPIPLEHVLDAVTTVARDLDLRLRWYESDDGPVATFEIPPVEHDGARFSVDHIELSEGRLFVAGRSVAVDQSSDPNDAEPTPELADHSGSNDKRQR